MNGCLLQDHKIIGTKPNSVTVCSALLVLNLNPLQSSPAIAFSHICEVFQASSLKNKNLLMISVTVWIAHAADSLVMKFYNYTITASQLVINQAY